VASIIEVAKLAGVSIATVSRVVTNSAFVELPTRQKVEKAILELNYVPNLLAKGMKEKSGGFIGLVIAEISHEFFSSVISDIEESVSKRGYTLILVNTEVRHGLTENEVIERLLGRKVDGIIVTFELTDTRLLNKMRSTGVPVVLMNSFHEQGGVHQVRVDDYRAGIAAGEHLAGLGHRELFCVTGGAGVNSRHRLSGFQDALGKSGITLSPDRVFVGDFEYSSGMRAARHVLEKGVRASAIWAQNDLMAIGAMNELLRSGIRVPDDISILGMDDSPIALYSHPRLSTLSQPVHEMAVKTVEVLMALRDGKKLEEMDVLYQPELIIRETTRRPNE
jgi:DNA-binding LacI/PurR family transcriptional regulator